MTLGSQGSKLNKRKRTPYHGTPRVRGSEEGNKDDLRTLGFRGQQQKMTSGLRDSGVPRSNQKGDFETLRFRSSEVEPKKDLRTLGLQISKVKPKEDLRTPGFLSSEVKPKEDLRNLGFRSSEVKPKEKKGAHILTQGD